MEIINSIGVLSSTITYSEFYRAKESDVAIMALSSQKFDVLNAIVVAICSIADGEKEHQQQSPVVNHFPSSICQNRD